MKPDTRPAVGVSRAKEGGRFPERESGMEQLSGRQALAGTPNNPDLK